MIDIGNKEKLPLETVHRKPHIHATKIWATRPDGLPEGCHTGGVWSVPGGTVWKPLDVLPMPNFPYRCWSMEYECLQHFKGQPFFPENWELKKANDRWFIVRQWADVFRREDIRNVSQRDLWDIEKAVYATNKDGWVIGDFLNIARDKETEELFFLDLSCAQKVQQSENEHRLVRRWLDSVDHEYASIKSKSVEVLHDYTYLAWLRGEVDKRREENCIYAVFDGETANSVIRDHECVVMGSDIQGVTWVLTQKPIEKHWGNMIIGIERF